MICCLDKLEVGKIYSNGSIYYNGEYHKIPMKILRIVTKEEFLKELEQDGTSHLYSHYSNDNFYEVSID